VELPDPSVMEDPATRVWPEIIYTEELGETVLSPTTMGGREPLSPLDNNVDAVSDGEKYA